MAYQAAHQTLDENSAAPYLARLKQADVELQQARIPPKFVTNFCFSPNGCAHVFRMVEWWHNLWPTKHTIADDIANMYNLIDRSASFAFLRKRRPDLIPVARLFYGDSDSRLWFRGSLIHALPEEDPISNPATSDNCLRSCHGGCQGCPLATLLTIGPYHETLSATQRKCPTTSFTCMADDTYMNDTGQQVYKSFDIKRSQAYAHCKSSSKITKVKCFSPTGDMSLAPADIAGSAHHPLGPLPGIKLVGCYLGRGDWPSMQAAQACRNRLRPLDMVDLVQDGPSIKNSETLKRQLIERIANSIPTHWLSLMPPCDTERAAIESMARITRSHELLYRYTDSPPERADLAMRQTFLPSPLGGLGSKNFPTNRHAYHAASVYATWRTTARIIPELASYDLTDEPSSLPPPAAAFVTAYRSVIDSHAAVVTAYTAIDAVLLFLVTGGKRSNHRPSYPVDRTFPSLASLSEESLTSSTTVNPSTKALASAVQHETYIAWRRDANAFDAANPDATVLNREARRCIATTQPNSDKWLHAVPEPSLPHTIMPSIRSTIAVQRRLGLYLTAGRNVYDARAQMDHVTVSQSDRLGDSILNKESKTHRHNLVNKAVYDAVNAQATTSVILGDKGDGAKRDRAEALERYAHYNKDHVPDIIEQGAAKNGNAVLYETKCYSQLVTVVSLGKGQAGTGGKPSTAMGHSVGFGCTEERLLYMTLGCIERGDPSQGAFSHDTGEGWVQAKEGHYHDAIYNKHNSVKVMIFDDLGGATSGTAKTIKGLAKNASGKGARDATDYGETHTKCFYQHHSTAISLACVQGSAMSLVTGLENLERSTTYDRNKRANTSVSRDFLSAYGVAAA